MAVGAAGAGSSAARLSDLTVGAPAEEVRRNPIDQCCTFRSQPSKLAPKPDAANFLKFFDYAAVDAGSRPDYVMKDEELVQKLPAFFRTLSGSRPTDEELENLIKLLRES